MTRLAALQRRIQSEFGLVPTSAWQAELGPAAARVAQRRGLPVAELPRLAEADRRLLGELAGELTIDESLFLRQAEHFELLASHVESRLERLRPEARLTFWSAGCARGEEPYSAAIFLEERLGEAARARVDFHGTDLRHGAVETARSGLFGRWSLRDAPAWLFARYFHSANGGAFQLVARIRSSVRFEQGAIGERLARLPSHSIDVLFFRNVAIYLEPSALLELYQGFARVLAPEGLLFTAPTDPRPPAALFGLREHASASVWSPRPLDFGARSARPCARAERVAPAPEPSGNEASWTGPLELGARSARPCARGEPVALSPDPRLIAASPSPGELLATARALSDRGENEEALRMTGRFLALEPAAKAGHELRGRILLSRGDREAVHALRRAVELAPDDRLARYWLALALRMAGDPGGCLAELETLRHRLAVSAPDDRLEDGISCATELSRAARLLQEELE